MSNPSTVWMPPLEIVVLLATPPDEIRVLTTGNDHRIADGAAGKDTDLSPLGTSRPTLVIPDTTVKVEVTGTPTKVNAVPPDVSGAAATVTPSKISDGSSCSR